MVQEQGAAGGGGGGGKKRNRNRNKNKNKGNNNGGGKSNSQSHDDTPPPQETRQREEQVAEEAAKVVPREVTPPVETLKSQEPQNRNQQQQQQNGGLVQDEAGLAKNLARDYMPPANWLELREAEKAFYERLAKGGAIKVLSDTADVYLWLTQYRTTLIVQSKLFPSKNLLFSICNAVCRIRSRRREGVGLRH